MKESTSNEKQKHHAPTTYQKTSSNSVGCSRYGKIGHKSEDCLKPVICGRCKKEGHVPRVCAELMPWDCIAPFVGFAAPGQGFHVIQNEGYEESGRETSNCALIRITNGNVTAKQLELEFRAQAGPQSTWRWFAKKESGIQILVLKEVLKLLGSEFLAFQWN
jgi:hypothetical protein